MFGILLTVVVFGITFSITPTISFSLTIASIGAFALTARESSTSCQ